MTDRRVVSKERGEQIAINHQIRFLETSAKANINIDKAFYDLAEAILDKVASSSQYDRLPGGGINVDQIGNAGNRRGCCDMI